MAAYIPQSKGFIGYWPSNIGAMIFLIILGANSSFDVLRSSNDHHLCFKTYPS
jgi:hypothetical protein